MSGWEAKLRAEIDRAMPNVIHAVDTHDGGSRRIAINVEGWKDAITTATATLVEAALEERAEAAVQCIPTTWLDPLLSGIGVSRLPWRAPEIEKLLRGLGERIRALVAITASTSHHHDSL